jgi:hypothetical protein
MKTITQYAALASVLAMLAVPALTTEVAVAACSGGYDSFGFPCGGGGGSNGGGGSYQGAPGPLLAGGLPFLALAGGAYWLVRRFRRKGK